MWYSDSALLVSGCGAIVQSVSPGDLRLSSAGEMYVNHTSILLLMPNHLTFSVIQAYLLVSLFASCRGCRFFRQPNRRCMQGRSAGWAPRWATNNINKILWAMTCLHGWMPLDSNSDQHPSKVSAQDADCVASRRLCEGDRTGLLLRGLLPVMEKLTERCKKAQSSNVTIITNFLNAVQIAMKCFCPLKHVLEQFCVV